MHSLAHYALLGSLIAGAAGALVLAVVTLKHGIARRSSSEEDDLSPEESARRVRTVRLADTVAVLCFAVAAGLGVVGITQSMRTTTAAIATVDDTAMREKVSALEGRLASAEQQLQSRQDAPDMRAWEERLARLENRLGAVEDRATVAERRATEADRRATDADRRAAEAEQLTRREMRTRSMSVPPPVAPPSKKAGAPAVANPAANAPASLPPGASPRLNPPGRDGLRSPELPPRPSLPEPRQEAAGPAATSESPAHDESAAPTVTTLPTPAPPALREPARAPADATLREPARPRTQATPREPLRADAVPREPARLKAEPPPREATFGDKPEATWGDKLRRDWGVIREHAERGGDEWRDGWRQIKSLFGQ